MWVKYIGIPYSTLNCAELVAEVLEKEFGRFDIAKSLRGHPSCKSDASKQSQAIGDDWVSLADRVEIPQNGDGVILKIGSKLKHMGIFADLPKGPHILHTVKNYGSVIEPASKMMTCTIEGFYRWK